MEILKSCSAPLISAICYLLIELLKRVLDHEKLKNAYPLISALIGASLGIAAFIFEPEIMVSDSLFACALIGMLSGLSATGGNELVKRFWSYFKSV